MRISDWTSDVCSSDLAEGRGNITINGTYRKEQAVYQGARGYSFDALAAADFSPGGSFTNAPGFVDLGPDGYQFDAGGNLIALGANPGAFEPFNFNPYNLLQAPNEQWNVTDLDNSEINNSLTIYVRG